MKKQPKTPRGQMRKLTSGDGRKNPETDTKKEHKKTMKKLQEEMSFEVDVA